MRLADRVAVITGAASGMGRAGAELFAAEGAAVVVVDRDADGAAETVARVERDGGRAVAVVADVSTAEGNEQAVATAVETYGGLDVLWANAGVVQTFTPITAMEPAEFDRLVAVNARGPWLAARAALPALRERDGGSIVITASLSGLKARADLSAYQTSKGAAVMLTRALAREFGPLGVRVNAVCPVASETPLFTTLVGDRDADAEAGAFAAAIPLGRLATPDDVARAALFLASDDAAFVTGVNLPVDGGASA